MHIEYRVKKDDNRGVMVGVYRIPGMDCGRNGFRRTLCTIDEAEYTETKAGKRERTDRQYVRFLRKLFYEKLEEILEETKEKQSPSIRFKDAAKLFIKEKETEGEVSAYTLISYARVFTFYIKTIGNHPIEEYNKGYRAKLIGALRDKKTLHPISKKVLRDHLEPKTINTYITKYNSFFLWCFDNEHTTRLHKIKRVKTERKLPTAYSQEHQEAIENMLYELACNPQRNRQTHLNLYRTYMMIAETGMRLKEVWSLRLSKIKLQNRHIQVRSVPEIGFGIKEKVEKNIGISDYLAHFLEHDLKNRNQDELWYLDNGCGKLYYTVNQTITRALTHRLRNHGLYNPEIKPWHGFRSRVASILIREKGIMYAKEQLGHQSISTTEGYMDTKILDLTESLGLLRSHNVVTTPKLLPIVNK